MSRIRSYLAGSSRSRTIMIECDRRLSDAKRCATAMQAMAEIEGNALRTAEAKNLLERDIAPLSKEIQRHLATTNPANNNNNNNTANPTTAPTIEQQRQELFYQAPDIESNNNNNNNNNSDMDALIQSSDDLLRDSQSILAETEEIGTRTLHQLGRQREQIENSNQQLNAIQTTTQRATAILSGMMYRAWKSKVSLYCMILLLTCANAFVLYRIYKKHHR